jgi:hypothetical protein
MVKQSYRVGIAAVAVTLSVGFALTLRLRSATHKITDQQLLHEALSEQQKAGNSGPSLEIFEQQATQGYYDDAMATARLSPKKDDLYWYLVELARIRTENGDIQGAKNMIRMFPEPDFQARMIKGIAVIQAGDGDLAGALETSASLRDSDEVLVEFAHYQIKRADFDGALKTAERTTPASADQLFYEIGDALRLRHEQSRVRELASHMSNRKLAKLFLQLAPFTLWERNVHMIPMNACEIAAIDAMEGKLPEASKALEHTHCWHSFVAIQYYAIDPIGAEKLLRSTTDPKDLGFGLVQLAIAAAKHGKIEDALRFDGEAKQFAESQFYDATLEIARAWTIRDGAQKVLPWARAGATPSKRVLALIGMAQALGHARPCNSRSDPLLPPCLRRLDLSLHL